MGVTQQHISNSGANRTGSSTPNPTAHTSGRSVWLVVWLVYVGFHLLTLPFTPYILQEPETKDAQGFQGDWPRGV